MRNVSDISCREKRNTRFTFKNMFSPENRAVYETKWKNMLHTDRPQNTRQYGAEFTFT